MSEEDFFKEENLVNSEEIDLKSSKYKLILSNYGTKPNCWNVTKGSIYKIGEEKPIFEVNRNYSSFPYLLIEDHPNGHDYFVCGADYQGQTVLELDTGKRRDYIPEEAKEGYGFCWSSYQFDAKSKILTVCGCYWACPYEYKFYDFADPIEKGWTEYKLSEDIEDCIDDDIRYPTIFVDEDNDIIITTYQSKYPVGENFDIESDNDEDYTVKIEDNPIVARKALVLSGDLELELIEEWVSEEEKERRQKQKEAHDKFNNWWETFKENDVRWLVLRGLITEYNLKPETYSTIGWCYNDWCPGYVKKEPIEKRACWRIHKDDVYTVDIEIAVVDGPIKLDLYKNGKTLEEKVFTENSINSIKEAVEYVKDLING